MSIVVTALCIYALIGASLNGLYLWSELKRLGSYEAILQDLSDIVGDSEFTKFVNEEPKLAKFAIKYASYLYMAIAWPWKVFIKPKYGV